MTVVGLIAKIIGCVLLALLALLILAAAAVLFVPFTYRLRGSFSEEDSYLSASAGWLAHLLGVRIVFADGQWSAAVWAAFFRKNLIKEEEKTLASAAEEEKRREKEEKEKDSARPAAEEEKRREEPKEEAAAKEGQEKDFDRPAADAVAKEEEMAKKEEKEEEASSPVKRLTRSVSARFTRLQKSMQNGKKTLQKVSRMVTDSKNQAAVSHLFWEIKKLCRALAPRRFFMHLHFAAGEPDLTGLLLGVCALWPSLYQKEGRIEADFSSEKAYLYGKADLAGRIFGMQIALAAIRIARDRDFRRMLRMVEKTFGS